MHRVEVIMWLRERGYQPDKKDNWVKDGETSVRYRFKPRSLLRETKRAGQPWAKNRASYYHQLSLSEDRKLNWGAGTL